MTIGAITTCGQSGRLSPRLAIALSTNQWRCTQSQLPGSSSRITTNKCSTSSELPLRGLLVCRNYSSSSAILKSSAAPRVFAALACRLVADRVDYLEADDSLGEFLDNFPSVSHEAAVAATRRRQRSYQSSMRILLDENLPRKLSGHIIVHDWA